MCRPQRPAVARPSGWPRWPRARTEEFRPGSGRRREDATGRGRSPSPGGIRGAAADVGLAVDAHVGRRLDAGRSPAGCGNVGLPCPLALEHRRSALGCPKCRRARREDDAQAPVRVGVRRARHRLGSRPQRPGGIAAACDLDPGVDGGRGRAPGRRARRSPSATRLDEEHVGGSARRDARKVEQGGEIDVERAPDPRQDGGRWHGSTTGRGVATVLELDEVAGRDADPPRCLAHREAQALTPLPDRVSEHSVQYTEHHKTNRQRRRPRRLEIVIECVQCGQENPDGARFCNSCGAPLAADAAPRARCERR